MECCVYSANSGRIVSLLALNDGFVAVSNRPISQPVQLGLYRGDFVLEDVLLVLALVWEPLYVILQYLVLNPVLYACEIVGAFDALQRIHVEVVVPDVVHLRQVHLKRFRTLFQLL